MANEPTFTKYDELRDTVKDGDTIAVRIHPSFYAVCISLATASAYVHTGIAVWLNDGLWIAEMDGSRGNILTPLSAYKDYNFDVYSMPDGCDTVKLDNLVTNKLRAHVKYDWVDIMQLAMYELMGGSKPVEDGKALVCSTYNSLIYHEAAGRKDPVYVVSPKRFLLDWNLKLKSQYRPSRLP